MALFKKRDNYQKTYKAVFSVSIDTSSEYRSEKRLAPGGDYWFGKQEHHATYDDLKGFAINILQNELKDECEQFIDIPIIDIKVKSVYEGSIELFFVVIFGVIATMASIKDLHDSLDFLRTLAEKKLEKRFREKYGDYFKININKQIPRNTDYYDDLKYVRRHGLAPFFWSQHEGKSKRDGFFWYLVVSNLVLLAIVVALVANAVKKMYF